MSAGVSERTSQCVRGSAAARLWLAAPVPVLRVVNLSCELRGTMPDGAVRLRGFLRDASGDQGAARRWRDRR
jgi:hypothetical protein